MKSILDSKLALCLVLFVGLVLGNNACQPYNEDAKLRKIDSLQNKVKEADNTLVIDLDEIKERHDSIKTKINYLKEHFTEEAGREVHFLISEYKAIGKNYENVIENYELREFENKKHKKRLKDLKKDVVEGNISDEKFKEIYKEEKKVINDHLDSVKELVSSVTEIEQMYQRTNGKVTRIYNRLRRENENQETVSLK